MVNLPVSCKQERGGRAPTVTPLEGVVRICLPACLTGWRCFPNPLAGAEDIQVGILPVPATPLAPTLGRATVS